MKWINKPLVLVGFCALVGSAPLTLWANDTPADLQTWFDKALAQSPQIAMQQNAEMAALSQWQASQSKQSLAVVLKSELSYSWMEMANFPRTANQLMATYPLYQPQLNDKSETAKLGYEGQQFKLAAEKQALLLKVAELYFKAIKQQAMLVYLNKDQQSLKSILVQIEKRYQLGYQNLNDLADLQSRMDITLAEQLKAKQELTQTQASLLALVGEDSADFTQQFATNPTWLAHLPTQIPQLTHSIDLAKSQKNQQAWLFLTQSHPSLQALNQQILAAKKQSETLLHEDGIQLNAFGALVVNRSDKHAYDDMQGVKAGLQLTVPLYLSGATQANQNKQHYVIAQIEQHHRLQSLSLQATAQNAWLTITSGADRLRALQAALASSTQSVQANEQAMQTGARNIRNLLEAQRQRHKVEKETRQLMAEIWYNYYLFNWATGSLNVAR